MLKRVLLLLIASFVCSASPQEAERRAPGFVGTWVGKWDNKWCTQFTITTDADLTNATVLYEVEENVGKPLNTFRRVGAISGTRLRIQDPSIEIFLSETPEQAVALGHFSTPAQPPLFANRRVDVV